MHLRELLDQVAKDYLITLLAATGGNVVKVAAAAGYERKSIYILLRSHGIDPNDYRRSAPICTRARHQGNWGIELRAAGG